MSHAEDTPITLTIIDYPTQLQVVSFRGHEALNQSYRFDIDLISPIPDLDISSLISRRAFLCLGSGHGIHGLIGRAQQLHAGRGVGHYRVRLEPRLHRLQQRRHRRIFQGMSAPQIIVQLLEEHGIGANDYRFEQMVGCYPPRPLCTQYDENDLHLLQRLCEEEGIHYRFEHRRSSHVLIFADDPAGFPEASTAVRFQMNDGRVAASASISQMAERFSMRPSYSSHHGLPIDRPEDDCVHAAERDLAANQVCRPSPPFDQQSREAIRHKQAGERRLERLRCERRQVHGLSNQPSLVSGQIMRVTDHPVTLFNDQWLLTEIHHAGKQTQRLRGLDPADITAIFAHILAQERQPDLGIGALRRGYRNHFKAIPWTMPFRPPLAHHKPRVQGNERAILMGPARQPVTRDEQGRIRARLHAGESAEVILWLPMILQADAAPLIAGTQVRIRYFDNDPDQPVICEVLEAAEDPVQQPQVRIDGLLVPMADYIHVSAGQTLQAFAPEGLTLHSPASRIELSTRGIRVIGPQTPARLLNREPQVPLQSMPSLSQPDLSALFQWLDP
ncbi:MAG: hypothetical protein JWQ69_747 [Pseudomonas sp.]|nr:hypothetical protein [Pseudomonas sp.]